MDLHIDAPSHSSFSCYWINQHPPKKLTWLDVGRVTGLRWVRGWDDTGYKLRRSCGVLVGVMAEPPPPPTALLTAGPPLLHWLQPPSIRRSHKLKHPDTTENIVLVSCLNSSTCDCFISAAVLSRTASSFRITIQNVKKKNCRVCDVRTFIVLRFRRFVWCLKFQMSVEHLPLAGSIVFVCCCVGKSWRETFSSGRTWCQFQCGQFLVKHESESRLVSTKSWCLLQTYSFCAAQLWCSGSASDFSAEQLLHPHIEVQVISVLPMF